MFNFIVSNLLFREGWAIVLVLLGIGVLGLFVHKVILYIAIAGFLFSLYFFRNPERQCVEAMHDSSVLVCPADGRVVDIQPGKISIFLSPLDVHVNRAPCKGVIEEIVYKPGKFMMAFVPKSSELNERNDVVLIAENGKKITTRQIAGTIARKICWWVKPGETLNSGQTFGMIRFGSRVDLIFDPGAITVSVKLNDYVYGGQTVLGRWS